MIPTPSRLVLHDDLLQVDYSPWTESHAQPKVAGVTRRPIATQFGKVLREERIKKGLSQEALALECDLDRTFVSMIERGVRQPTLQTLFTLCGILKIKPSRMVRLLEGKMKL